MIFFNNKTQEKGKKLEIYVKVTTRKMDRDKKHTETHEPKYGTRLNLFSHLSILSPSTRVDFSIEAVERVERVSELHRFFRRDVSVKAPFDPTDQPVQMNPFKKQKSIKTTLLII